MGATVRTLLEGLQGIAIVPTSRALYRIHAELICADRDPTRSFSRADLDQVPSICIRPHRPADGGRERRHHHREDREPGEEGLI